MRRPCWHFLQAGHSKLASTRHPPSPDDQRRLREPGPAVPGPEHLREVVHGVEVLDAVALLPREEADVDQHAHDADEVLGAGDAPVGEDGRRQQAELLERQVAARPGELRTGEVPPRREAALRELERRQGEQVAALVVAPIARADLRERRVQRREVAHGVASRGSPSALTRTATGRDGRGSSSASSSTWSSVSTGLMSSSFVTSSGTSIRSFWLRAGTSTVFMPARAAAVSFSLSPPMGSTRPRSVSSPVIATSWRDRRWHRSDASAVAIVMPADGPSFGTAPAGTCRC